MRSANKSTAGQTASQRPRIGGQPRMHGGMQLIGQRSSAFGRAISGQRLAVAPQLPAVLPMIIGHRQMIVRAPRSLNHRSLLVQRRVLANSILQDGRAGPSLSHLAAFGLKVVS